MMNSGCFAGNFNLDDVDPACDNLDYLTIAGPDMNCDYVMNNIFAFGGINTSIIFRKFS